MRFIEWIPMPSGHRPYETTPNIQPVGRCDRCGYLYRNRQLTEYPDISERAPRRVCDKCLSEDQRSGLYDAIMDIWDNYEEYKGIGHRKTVSEFLAGLKGVA